MGKPNSCQGLPTPISFKQSSIKKKKKKNQCSSLDFQNITSKSSLYFSLLLFHSWRKYHQSFTFLLLSSLATPIFIQCTDLWPHYKQVFSEINPDMYFGHKLDFNEIIQINARPLTKTITVTPGQNHFLPSYTCELQSVNTSFFFSVLHGRKIRNILITAGTTFFSDRKNPIHIVFLTLRNLIMKNVWILKHTFIYKESCYSCWTVFYKSELLSPDKWVFRSHSVEQRCHPVVI